MSLRERYAERRRRRTWEKLCDAEHEVAKWGFGMTTAEKARWRRRIRALEERVQEIGMPDKDWLERGGHG